MLDPSILRNMEAMRSGFFYCTDYTCQTSAGLGAQTTSAISSDEVPRCCVSHDDGFRFHRELTTICPSNAAQTASVGMLFRVHVHLLSLISLRCWQSPYIHPLNCLEVLANTTSSFMLMAKGNEGGKETHTVSGPTFHYVPFSVFFFF